MCGLGQLQLSGRPAYRQIATHVRRRIAAGHVAVGAKLPPVRDLAARWGTNFFTVQQALGTLAAEGLIERRPRSGIVVVRRQPSLRCVGMYFGEDVWRGPHNAFARRMHEVLVSRLAADGITVQTWVDGRLRAETGTACPEVRKAVEERAIQGLVGASLGPKELGWIADLGIPYALLSSAPTASRVAVDLPQMVTVALRTLRDRGCRSAGMISVRPTPPLDRHHAAVEYRQFYPTFFKQAAKLGLATRAEWLRAPGTPDFWAEHFEAFGYREFHALWSLAERPDGLIVYPDVAVRGAILAMAELRVRVPEELKLALHRNEGVPLLCPLPATWLVAPEREIAEALVAQLQRTAAGDAVTPITVPFHIVGQDERVGAGAPMAACGSVGGWESER